MDVVKMGELMTETVSRELEGADHGVDISLIFVAAEPGAGPRLHRHAYPEVFVTLAGSALFTAGGESRRVEAGEVTFVPPGVPHRFESIGPETLRQVDIHLSPRFVTEWLEDQPERTTD